MTVTPFTVCIIGFWITSMVVTAQINPLEDENYHYYPYYYISEDDPSAELNTSESVITEINEPITTELPEIVSQIRRDDPLTTKPQETKLNDIEMLKRTLGGNPGEDYPIYSTIPRTTFNCELQQLSGLYADTATKCQVFHICSPDGRHYSFLCPNGTIFNQRHLVCDWWYNVQCTDSPQLYSTSNQNVYGNSVQSSAPSPASVSQRILDEPPSSRTTVAFNSSKGPAPSDAIDNTTDSNVETTTQHALITKPSKFRLPGPHGTNNLELGSYSTPQVVIPTEGGFLPSVGPPVRRPSTQRAYNGKDVTHSESTSGKQQYGRNYY